MHDTRSSILSGKTKPGLLSPKKSGGEDRSQGGLGKVKVRRVEARTTNQRAEERLRDLVKRSKILFRGEEYDVAVVNVSSRGAMIESGIEPRIGEALEIQFFPHIRTLCLVRWVRDGRIGLEFADETIVWDCSLPHRTAYDRRQSPDEPEGGERERVEREQRHALCRDGLLYWSGMSIRVRIRNISERGANVEGERTLWAGAEVELDLGEAGWQMAEIRWVENNQLGLHFYEPVDLELLTRQAGVADEEDGEESDQG